ncbi:MAG: Fe-S protein assembly chaperone HscA [Azonexus sp.]|jgi:molecular chaperone HscA|nr:Fe-S protein assembly chaperone HscA [Azonexus sp.]
MALFQIAEPGESAAPHEHKLAIGIDLGTTNSLVATVQSGLAVCLNDPCGRPLLPSVVRYHADGSTEVGFAAQKNQTLDPRHTIVSVKRLMGREQKDIAHIEAMPYEFVEAAGMVKLRTPAGVKSPVEISAEILKALKSRAEAALFGEHGGELVGAVITVPAYFDDAQRQATKDAARLAGLNVLRLLNEPTAAAIAYGLDNAAEGVYAVYDLGGGTFDISILKLTKGVFEVLATGGDSALGGDDFDHRIYCWVVEQARLQPLTPEDARLLMMCSREAKEFLTLNPEARLTARLSTSELVDLKLDAATFAAISQTLVSKTLQPVKRALRDAGLRVEEVKGVVMVGGATRMPQIQKAVGDFFQQEPLTNLDPDKVVALGAATQANLLAGNKTGRDDWLLLDVIPLSLGLETMGGLTEKVIPRNATIPTARAQEFTTFKDGQTAMSIHVVQGEREMVADCRSLARFELRGIPPMVAGAARIRVTFQVDADGLLSVAAREQTTGVEASVTVKPSYGLSDDEIASMLQDSLAHAKDDAMTRALRESQVEARRMIEATEAALAEDAHLLKTEEMAKITAAIAKLRDAAAGDNRRHINMAMDDLGFETQEFAHRRMDQSIKKVLSGRKVDDINMGENT